MAFEVFDKRSAPMAGAPSVTLQKRGIVSINGPAHALINRARVVELLFDRERRVVALRPADPSPTTYELRKPSPSGQTLLSAAAFTKAYDIETEVSHRFEPFIEEGMLCFDLNGPSVEVRGNRSPRRDIEESPEHH